MFASGLALGASRTPRDVMLKDAAPPGQIGKVFGFVSAGLPLGSALTPVPFGFLIDRGHPELILVLVAALLLASLLCMGTARSNARQALATMPRSSHALHAAGARYLSVPPLPHSLRPRSRMTRGGCYAPLIVMSSNGAV